MLSEQPNQYPEEHEINNDLAPETQVLEDILQKSIADLNEDPNNENVRTRVQDTYDQLQKAQAKHLGNRSQSELREYFQSELQLDASNVEQLEMYDPADEYKEYGKLAFMRLPEGTELKLRFIAMQNGAMARRVGPDIESSIAVDNHVRTEEGLLTLWKRTENGEDVYTIALDPRFVGAIALVADGKEYLMESHSDYAKEEVDAPKNSMQNKQGDVIGEEEDDITPENSADNNARDTIELNN